MARAHVVQHTGSEGLGHLADWLPGFGVDVHPTHPYLGHRVPRSVEGDALIVLGGPMGAYDDEVAPWLPEVRDLMASAVEDGVPTLGVCLGAQLLAVATGGEVQRGERGPELGLATVQVHTTDELLDTPGDLAVVQWHYDAVTRLPAEAVPLASSAVYENQAFRIGEVAWGVQFHVEATAEMVAQWARHDGQSAAVPGAVAEAMPDLMTVGERIARRFATIITG